MLNPELLELLVCPLGKAPLEIKDGELVCTACGPRFAVRDGIPNMLIEEATLPEGCGSLSELACVKSGRAKLELS